MPLDPTRLKALRIEAGLTARRLQTAAGVQNPTVYRIESGETVTVTVETMERIADALGRRLGRRVTVDELLTGARPTIQPDHEARERK